MSSLNFLLNSSTLISRNLRVLCKTSNNLNVARQYTTFKWLNKIASTNNNNIGFKNHYYYYYNKQTTRALSFTNKSEFR